MKRLLFILLLSSIFGTVTDIDGNVYETVRIGDQLWMAENLKVTHYNNGDEIPTGYSNDEWSELETGAYINEPSNVDIYGNLYNWYTVDDNRGLCMEGWHVPSDDEYLVLINYLGGSSVAGGKMKECTQGSCPESEYWYSPNTGATNESGYSAVPAGYKDPDYTMDIYSGEHNYIWATNSSNTDNAIRLHLSSYGEGAGINSNNKKHGFSVRCLSDEIQSSTILVPDDFATIQEAIDYSIDGDTILVSAGTYYENINFNGKNISVIGEDRETTIIDGGGIDRVVKLEYVTATLSGFTITNGKLFESGNSGYGAGIYAEESNLNISNIIIDNNINEGFPEGGGIFLKSSSLDISNSIISNNSAYRFGGICVYTQSSLQANNVLFDGNNSANNASAIGTVSAGSVNLENCTFVNNTGQDPSGRPIYAETGITITNCISYNNSTYMTNNGSTVFGDYYGNCGAINVSHSRSTENYYVCATDQQIDITGNGNIFVDPQFNDDYTLQETSPCIDTGDPDSELDPDGTRADMGAYYFHQILGCIDETAINYNPEATSNDGSCYHDIVTDIDGNEYQAVQIGDQLWIKENLKVTHYNNGDEIPTGLDNNEWSTTANGAYAIYGDSQENADIYGNLYNWYTVNDERGVCPEGWHVPSDEEFMALEMSLGMSESEANSTGWRGTNEGSMLGGNADLWYDGELEQNSEFGTSGFAALPAGYRASFDGGYSYMGNDGYFWSSTGYIGDSAWARILYYSHSNVHRYNDYMHYGFPVRCVEDTFILGDINEDGVLNIQDILIIIDLIFEPGYPADYYEIADMNEDGILNIQDIILILAIILAN